MSLFQSPARHMRCVGLTVLLAVTGYWAGAVNGTPTCDDTCERSCVAWKYGEDQFAKLNYAYASSNCGALHYANQEYHYYVVSGPSFGTVRQYEGSPQEKQCYPDLSTLTYWRTTVACTSGSYNDVNAWCYGCSTVPES